MLDRPFPSSARNAQGEKLQSISQGETFLDNPVKNGNKEFVALVVPFSIIKDDKSGLNELK